MDKTKILEIYENVQHKSNKDLHDAEEFLYNEFEETKKLIIQLTNHLDSTEKMYGTIVNEINKRKVL